MLKTAPEKRTNGFTLIELFVVIAIIALLTTVFLVNYESSRKKSRDSKGRLDLNQINRALEMKYTDQKYYPDLPPASTTISTSLVDLTPYLSPIPVSNGVRSYYWYDGVLGTTQKYCVFFQLEQDPAQYFYTAYNGIGITDSGACPNF